MLAIFLSFHDKSITAFSSFNLQHRTQKLRKFLEISFYRSVIQSNLLTNILEINQKSSLYSYLFSVVLSDDANQILNRTAQFSVFICSKFLRKCHFNLSPFYEQFTSNQLKGHESTRGYWRETWDTSRNETEHILREVAGASRELTSNWKEEGRSKRTENYTLTGDRNASPLHVFQQLFEQMSPNINWSNVNFKI